MSKFWDPNASEKQIDKWKSFSSTKKGMERRKGG